MRRVTTTTVRVSPTVQRWRAWFAREGVTGLLRDRTRGPGTPLQSLALVERAVGMTLDGLSEDATRRTGRTAARTAGTPLRPVQRVRAVQQPAPRRARIVEPPRDLASVPKLHDAAVLHPHPRAHAFLPSVHERSRSWAPNSSAARAEGRGT
jgi:hypothetical protein